jgi:hypothetical protein
VRVTVLTLRDERPDAAHDRLEVIANRLRSNGILVVEIRPGRWPDPTLSLEWISFGGVADRPSPNDLLDQAREAATTQIDWTHALLDDYKAAMALTAFFPSRFRGPLLRPYAVRTNPRPSTARRPMPPRRRDTFADLVAETPIRARMIVQAGAQPVVEFPEPWLDLL